jgi:hypothetical protein
VAEVMESQIRYSRSLDEAVPRLSKRHK